MRQKITIKRATYTDETIEVDFPVYTRSEHGKGSDAHFTTWSRIAPVQPDGFVDLRIQRVDHRENSYGFKSPAHTTWQITPVWRSVPDRSDIEASDHLTLITAKEYAAACAGMEAWMLANHAMRPLTAGRGWQMYAVPAADGAYWHRSHYSERAPRLARLYHDSSGKRWVSFEGEAPQQFSESKHGLQLWHHDEIVPPEVNA